jgi:tetratricopeptide (TPR) repeat protein
LNDLQEMLVDDDEDEALTLPPIPSPARSRAGSRAKQTPTTTQKRTHSPEATDKMGPQGWADMALARISSSPKRTDEPTPPPAPDLPSLADDDDEDMTVATGEDLAAIRNQLFQQMNNGPADGYKDTDEPTPKSFQGEATDKVIVSSLDDHTLGASPVEASALLQQAESAWGNGEFTPKELQQAQPDASEPHPATISSEHTLGTPKKLDEQSTGRWFGMSAPPAHYDENASTMLGGKPPVSPELDELPTSNGLPSSVDTQRTSLPVSSEGATTFLFVALDAEGTRNETLSKSERIQALDGIKSTLLEQLQQGGFFVEESSEQRVVSFMEGSKKGVSTAILTAKQLLEAANRYDPPVAARLRMRCVISTVTDALERPQERAFAVAGRLLRGMPVDRIWLDWTTYCLMGEGLHCQEVVLPNLEESVYEVEALETHRELLSDEEGLQSEADAPTTGWVERPREMDALMQRWQHVRSGMGQAVLLLGAPGSGRSRLTDAFFQHISNEAMLFLGGSRTCPTEPNTSPYLAGLLQSHLQTHHIDRNRGLRQQVTSLAIMANGEQTNAEQYAQQLFELSTEGPSSEQQAAEEALLWYMKGLTAQRPVLVVFDDLFLFERRTKWLFDALIQQIPARMMVVIVSSQGEYEEVLFSSLSQAQHIEVGDLDESQSRKLLDQLKLANHVSNKQIARIIEEASGNPKLLLALAAATEKSKQREVTWSYDLAVPNAVERLMLQQQKDLSHLEKDTLRKAAVIGDRFWKGAVESLERISLSDGSWGLREGVVISHVDDRGGSLKALVDKQLIQEVPHSSIPHEREYRFPHRLLRRIMMRQIPVSIRQQLHRHVSQWLSLRDEEHHMAFEIARHLKLAGDHEGATWRLYEAAQIILKEQCYNKALSLLTEALEVLGDRNPVLRLKLLHHSGDCYLQVGDLEAATQLYEEASKLSWRLTAPKWGAKTFLALSECWMIRGEFQRAESFVMDAKTLAKQCDETMLIFRGNLQNARIQLLMGELGPAETALMAVREDLTPHKDKVPELWARLLSTEGWLYRLKSLWRDAVKILQESINLLRKEGNFVGYAEVLTDQAQFYMAAGDEDAAIPILEEAIGILRRREAFFHLQRALLCSATISLSRRDAQKALTCLREAWQHCQMAGENGHSSQISAALAATHVLLRQPQEALHFSTLAIQRLKEGPALVRANTYYFLGEAAASMTPEQLEMMFSPMPPRLPEGGMPTFLFLKSVELYKRAKESARQIRTLLSLGRSLLIGGFTQTAINVLERGMADAERVGLGLLLERLQNQRRLLSQEESAPASSAPQLSDTHSTMVVRKGGRKTGQAKPFASEPMGRPAPTSPTAPPSRFASQNNPQSPYFQGARPGASVKPNPYQQAPHKKNK